MALVLARLRLALQLGTARASSGGLALFVAGWVLGVLAGAAGGYLVAWLDSGASALGELFVLLLFVAIFVAWVVIPIGAPVPVANLIDPAVLEQYPLSRAQQVGGLLLGGLLTPTAAATFLTSAGGVAAIHVGGAERATAVAAAVLFTVMCVASSYAVRALLAEALSDRRGRDVAVVVSTLLIIGMYALSHTLTTVVAAAEGAATGVVEVLTWTPPGAAGSLAYVVAGGDVVGATARAAVVVAAIALALVIWGIALRRHVKGHSARAAPTREHSARGLALVPPIFHGARPGPALAAASQQLRYLFFRAPRAAQSIVLGPVIGIMFASAQLHTAGLPFAAAVAAVAMGAGAMLNLFGFDGRGVELTVQTGGPLSAVLRGKLVAVSLFLVPAVAALTVGLGLAAGLGDQIPLALVAAYAALLVAVAIGAVASAGNPYDQEAPQGDRSEITTRMLGAFALAFALVYGVGWLSAWASPLVPVPVVLGVGLIVAAVAAAIAVHRAGGFLDRHPERLLAAFTPR